MGGFLAERDDALLASLAEHVYRLLLEVDVAQVEADSLGAAEPAGVDELDERRIPHRERPRTGDRLDDCLHLFDLGRLRQAPGPARRERGGGNLARPEREAKKRAHRGKPAGYRGGRQTAA